MIHAVALTLVLLLVAPSTAVSDPAKEAQMYARLSLFEFPDLHSCRGTTNQGWLFSSREKNTCMTPELSDTDTKISVSGEFSGEVLIGFCKLGRGCWMIEMEDCSERNPDIFGRYARVPQRDCPKENFRLHWDQDAGKVQLEARDRSGTFPLWNDIASPRFPNGDGLRFVVRATGAESYVKNLKITSEQAAWVTNHLSKGAVIAGAGTGKCSSKYAQCGDKCFGVCPENPVTSQSFCMCYPKGYTGVSGAFHPGASCLKNCGTGERVEDASHAEASHKAYAEGTEISIRDFLDSDDDGHDDILSHLRIQYPSSHHTSLASEF